MIKKLDMSFYKKPTNNNNNNKKQQKKDKKFFTFPITLFNYKHDTYTRRNARQQYAHITRSIHLHSMTC